MESAPRAFAEHQGIHKIGLVKRCRPAVIVRWLDCFDRLAMSQIISADLLDSLSRQLASSFMFIVTKALLPH